LGFENGSSSADNVINDLKKICSKVLIFLLICLYYLSLGLFLWSLNSFSFSLWSLNSLSFSLWSRSNISSHCNWCGSKLLWFSCSCFIISEIFIIKLFLNLSNFLLSLICFLFCSWLFSFCLNQSSNGGFSSCWFSLLLSGCVWNLSSWRSIVSYWILRCVRSVVENLSCESFLNLGHMFLSSFGIFFWTFFGNLSDCGSWSSKYLWNVSSWSF